MFIYSQRIIQFVQEIRSAVRSILTREIGVKVVGDRFSIHRVSYPLAIVIYNHKSMLGYFDSDFFELGFHERLMLANKDQLLNIIRHELAHYMTFIAHGPAVLPHGAEFKAFCHRLGWGEEVYRATICLEGSDSPLGMPESAILRKIQKLMALSTSSNPNEAEQAWIKSQQLLLKHNLDAKHIANEDEEKIILKRILKQKKENAKMRAIAKILENFFVSTVYRRTNDFLVLEILGSAVNIEIAEYVSNFLQHELERLWDHSKQRLGLNGIVAKNSFFLGIAKGYSQKIQALKKEYSSEITKDLMLLEQSLIDAKALVYKRLSSTRSKGYHCPNSAALGETLGRQMNINPGLYSPATPSQTCLNHN